MTAIPPKTVLVHDWLNGMRGGERCLELIAAEYPAAPIYTLLYQPEFVSEGIRSWVRPVTEKRRLRLTSVSP